MTCIIPNVKCQPCDDLVFGALCKGGHSTLNISPSGEPECSVVSLKGLSGDVMIPIQRQS